MGGYYYSSQRAVIYNDYPNDYVPRTDISFYTLQNGIIIGLIFSGEVFDAVSTLLHHLIQLFYQKQNMKK